MEPVKAWSFVRLRDLRVEKISLSLTERISLSISHSSVHIAGGKGGCHSFEEELWWEVVKSSRKPLLMKFAISCSLLSQFLILSFMLTIRFLLLRTRAEVWKKVEFLSPSTTQERRAFILQKSASSLEFQQDQTTRISLTQSKTHLGHFQVQFGCPTVWHKFSSFCEKKKCCQTDFYSRPEL